MIKDIKEFKNKYGLSGLHSQPTGYMNFEDKTEEVFKDVELLIKKTREETIREIEEEVINKIDSDFLWKLRYSEISVSDVFEEIRSIFNKLKK